MKLLMQGAGNAGHEGMQVLHHDRQDFGWRYDEEDPGQPGRAQIALELPPRQAHDASPGSPSS